MMTLIETPRLSFNVSSVAQVVTDYAFVILQQGWRWTCKRLEVSHFIAAFIFFWWSRRQPKRNNNRRSKQHRHKQLTTNAGVLKRLDSSSSILSDDALWDTNDSSGVKAERHGDATSSSSSSLLPSFPSSTRQERQRFLSANKGNIRKAVTQLQAYSQWRYEHTILEHEIRPSIDVFLKHHSSDNDNADDENDWIVATAVAMQAHSKKNKNCQTITSIRPNQVPQVARMLNTLPDTAIMTKGQPCGDRPPRFPCLDRRGHRMIHITPGRMGNDIPLKAYATAIALYIDRKFVSHHHHHDTCTERVTLVIDVRGGIGWPNRNGAQLLPFMQHIIPLLLQHFPGRLAQCIVFPVPPNFEWVWQIVRCLLNAETANCMQVVTGPAFKECPPPYDKLNVLVDERIVRYWEKLRKAAFIVMDGETEQDNRGSRGGVGRVGC